MIVANKNLVGYPNLNQKMSYKNPGGEDHPTYTLHFPVILYEKQCTLLGPEGLTNGPEGLTNIQTKIPVGCNGGDGVIWKGMVSP